MTRAARAALAAACALLCAGTAAGQTGTGLDGLYERYPLNPRGGEVPARAPAAAGPQDDGGWFSTTGLAALGLLAAVPVALLAGPALRRRRRGAAADTPLSAVVPVDWRGDNVPQVGEDTGPVDLTSASERELARLSGVGPEIARRIIAWRDQNGGFHSVDQLAEVRGIGARTLEALRPQVMVPPPAEEPEPEPRREPAPPPAPPGPQPRALREPRRGGAWAYVRDNRGRIALIAVIALAVASQVVLAAVVLRGV